MCGHLLFKHMLMAEDFPNHERFNIASDCEINSSIPILQKDPYCFPAKFGLENHKGTKYYYEQFPENIQESIENHSHWKDFRDLSDAEKQLIGNQIDYQAKEVAEQIKKTCGNIPKEFVQYIDSLFAQKPQIFNWKAYFKRVIGNLITSDLYLTRMRPSRRFPDSRGVRFKRKASVLVGMDTSGSISPVEIEDFISEIHHLYKSGVKVTIAQVDTRITHIEEYRGKFDQNIYGRGGTDFRELIQYYLDNQKEFSTIVIFTDGCVSLNLPLFRNGVWVISPSGQRQDYPGTTIYMP